MITFLWYTAVIIDEMDDMMQYQIEVGMLTKLRFSFSLTLYSFTNIESYPENCNIVKGLLYSLR